MNRLNIIKTTTCSTYSAKAHLKPKRMASTQTCVAPACSAHKIVKNIAGFTLIELLITTIVLAILASLAVPSFESTLRNSAITSETNRFVASIQYARNEAIKRNTPVVMQRTSNTNATWSEGWRTFQDASGEAGGSAFSNGNDETIRNTEATADGVSIMANAPGNNWLAFAGNGMTTEAGNSIYHICHRNDPSTGRRVTVNRAGRTMLDDIPNGQGCTPN